jgi:hypothetical protein
MSVGRKHQRAGLGNSAWQDPVTTRKIHRVIGVILILPFLGWALTGFVFFLKPGYAGAYEILKVKTYQLESSPMVTPDPNWQEFRYLKTILGNHLLVRTDSGWEQLDPATKLPKAKPSEADFRTLLKDAFSRNPSRYGEVTSVSGLTARTNRGIEVTLDWSTLSLQQTGNDTAWIDRLYKIHYLQWTGFKTLDKAVGLAGLILVISLTALGALLAIKR